MAVSAAIVAGAAGGGVQSYAQWQAGMANQKIADYNADSLDAQARDAISRGDEMANSRRIEGRTTAGTQRVAFASQGVLINDGSASDVVYDTLSRTDQDVVTIRTNAALQAWGYSTQSKIKHYEGKVAHRQGDLAVVSTLIGTAGKSSAGFGA